MDIGMLWFDDTPNQDWAHKVRRAAEYYRQKYGEQPNLCYVHPSMVSEEREQLGGVEIRPAPTILPHHLWMGVEREQPAH